MISCKEATDYISRKEEGKLSIPQRIQLWRHLLICSMCRLFNLQNQTLIKNAVVLATTNAILTQEEKQEIIEVVERKK